MTEPTTPAAALDALMAAADEVIQASGGVPLTTGAARNRIEAAALAYGREVAIEELEAALEGGAGGCLCGAVDPEWICAGHKRLPELRRARSE